MDHLDSTKFLQPIIQKVMQNKFLLASLFIHALRISTMEIMQTSLDIPPEPKLSFCHYLLDHNPQIEHG